MDYPTATPEWRWRCEVLETLKTIAQSLERLGTHENGKQDLQKPDVVATAQTPRRPRKKKERMPDGDGSENRRQKR